VTSSKVATNCCICQKELIVYPSRLRKSKSITCSRECLSKFRSSIQIAVRGSAESRNAICDYCGLPFTRKPSQISKYGKSYCGNSCKVAGSIGVSNTARINGFWIPCERCGTNTWRTPGVLMSHTYCSRECSWEHKRPKVLRSKRTYKNCITCGTEIALLPHQVRRGIKFCSHRCSAICIQGMKRGTPGNKWTISSREKLSETLIAKYKTTWSSKRDAHSIIMRGQGNPMWRDGSSMRKYAPGWTERIKLQVAKRDGFKCRICGAQRGKGTHAVHHVDRKKADHSMINLVLLCRPCHGRLHAGMIDESSIRPA
jgi:endogenous inhibitor of DNA gyrase (YacG/DUF329 family)